MTSRSPIPSLLPAVRWGLTATLAYLVLWDQRDEIGALELGFIAALLASNLLAPRLERWFGEGRASAALVLSDAILLGLGLFLADSSSQDLVIGAFFCILVATLADNERRLIGVALLVPGVYVLFELRTTADLLQPAVLLRLPLLCFATLTYGLLVARLRSETEARKRAERRASELESLLALTRNLCSTLASAEIVDGARAAILSATGATAVRHVEAHDEDDDSVAEAIRARRPVSTSRPGAPTTIIAPLLHRDRPLGALVVDLGDRGPPGAEVLGICEIVADAAALALVNARQYEELEEAERTKSEFLRNLSHEMHTPLHAILGFGEIAADAVDQQDEETVREAIGRMREKGAEMASHVESLLQLSRLTLGRERSRPTCVDVPELLGRCVESARRAAASSAVDFRLRISPDVATAFVDGEKLERIVSCLLSNATKFSEQGTVEVDATVEPNGTPDSHVLHLSVRDQGIGLDPRTASRAFDDFRQGDGSLTRRYPGLGLGLSISRRLASLLGGSVQVESASGRGAQFDLRVPVS